MLSKTASVASKSRGRSYGGSSAEARRLERRGKLLAAARQVFGEKGFHTATVRSICEAAGLTERYFYENFENSEALFIAMHRQTSERILKRLRDVSRAAAERGEDRIRAMLRAYYDDIFDDPVSTRLFAVDAGFISPTAREVCASWRATFGQLLVEASDPPAYVASSMLRSGVIKGLLGIGVDWMDDGFAVPLDEIVEDATMIAGSLRTG